MKALGLNVAEQISPRLQEKVVYLATKLPSFRDAHESLDVVLQLELSRKFVERFTEKIGGERVAERDAAAAAWLRRPLAEKLAAPPGVKPLPRRARRAAVLAGSAAALRVGVSLGRRTGGRAGAKVAELLGLLRRENLREAGVDVALQLGELLTLLGRQVQLLLDKSGQDLARTRRTAGGRTKPRTARTSRSGSRSAGPRSTGARAAARSPGSSAVGRKLGEFLGELRAELVLCDNAVLIRVAPLHQRLQPRIGDFVRRQFVVAVRIERHQPRQAALDGRPGAAPPLIRPPGPARPAPLPPRPLSLGHAHADAAHDDGQPDSHRDLSILDFGFPILDCLRAGILWDVRKSDLTLDGTP